MIHGFLAFAKPIKQRYKPCPLEGEGGACGADPSGPAIAGSEIGTNGKNFRRCFAEGSPEIQNTSCSICKERNK